MTDEPAQELLRQLCADLRLMWTQAGGPTLRVLSLRVHLGKSQVGNILSGRIREPPGWQVVDGLITGFIHYAQEHDRVGRLSVSTGVAEFWRPRYAVVEHVFGLARQSGGARPDQLAAGSPGPPRLQWVAPHQVPTGVSHLVGRTAELATLTEAIDSGRADETTVISVLNGTAGVGKSALAVHWARLARPRYQDGDLYADLHGHGPGPAVDPTEVLHGFLRALGVAAHRIPHSVAARATLYRSLLAGRRVLVVLDNASGREQIRPLLPDSAGCLVVVTSRTRLTSLVAADTARALTVDVLTAAQSRELLVQRLGSSRPAAESPAIDEIVAGCAGLPAALVVVSARAAAQPHLPLGDLAARLRDRHDRWNVLTGGDPGTDVRSMFARSYDGLSPGAAGLFRLLGLHPGPDISAPAAASLTGLPVPRVRSLLDELVAAHLVVECRAARYTFHGLLRAYAAELVDTTDPDTERDAAQRRVLDHYVRTAHAAALLLSPQREPTPLGPPRPGIVVEALADQDQAMAWFEREHRVLLAAIASSPAVGCATHPWQLARALADYLDRTGRWQDNAAAQHAAVACATRCGDRAAQAAARRQLARAYGRLARFDDAHDQLRHACQLHRRDGDQAGLAHTHLDLAVLHGWQGHHAEALDHARQAIDLFRAARDLAGHARALGTAGEAQARLGEYEPALASCRRGLALIRDLADPDSQADIRSGLGYAHQRLGHHRRAVACYRRSLELVRGLGDRSREADILARLGETYQAGGDLGGARRAWQQALAILDDFGHWGAQPIRTRLGGLPPQRERGGPPRGPSHPALRLVAPTGSPVVPRDRAAMPERGPTTGQPAPPP